MATEATNLLREALDMPRQPEYNHIGVGQNIDRNQNVNDIGHPASHLLRLYGILYNKPTAHPSTT